MTTRTPMPSHAQSCNAIIGIDPSLSSCGVSDGEHHALVKTVPGAESVDMLADLDRRCDEVVDGIAAFINEHCAATDEIVICIEAPMLSAHGAGAHFLFEAGWLYHSIYSYLGGRTVPNIVSFTRVPSPTLRKWATGKGNTRKDEMKLKVYRKFGVEFEGDPGADKLFAFLLAKFGQAVLAGDVAFESPRRRGKGKDATARSAKGARDKARLEAMLR